MQTTITIVITMITAIQTITVSQILTMAHMAEGIRVIIIMDSHRSRCRRMAKEREMKEGAAILLWGLWSVLLRPLW